MHLTYLDDSGSDSENPIVVIGAAIIEGICLAYRETTYSE